MRAIVLTLMLTMSLKAVGSQGYLIITHQSLLGTIQPFVEWKTQQGFDVTVATVEEIGNDTSEIRAFIHAARDTLNPPPEFVLLIGNPNTIPTYLKFFDVGVPNIYPFDFLYVTQDTLTMETEMSIGRIPFSDSIKVRNVLRKIIYYEKTPDAHDVFWLSRGIVTLNDDMVRPISSLIQQWMLNNGMRDVSYSWVQWPESDYFGRLMSDRRSFHNHRGYPLRTPFVFSNDSMPFVSVFLTCGSADFLSDESEANNMLEDPSGMLTGAATVVGNSGVVIDTSNTVLRMRNFADSIINHAIWLDDLVTIGKAVDLARVGIAQSFDVTRDTARLAAWELTVLGDPSLNVWHGIPDRIFMHSPDTVQAGSEFTVYASAMNMVGSATKAVISQHDSIVAIDTVGADGEVSFTLPDTGTYTLTVSSPFNIPAQKTIYVVNTSVPTHPSLYIYNADVTDQDSTQFFIPTDTLVFRASVMNCGADTAHNLHVAIETHHPVEPTLSEISLGDLAPGQTISIDTIIGVLSIMAMDQEEFTVTATFSCDGCSPVAYRFRGWVERWYMVELALNYREMQQDTNSFMDPGDTLALFLRFHRNGMLPFGPHARVTLRCSNQDVTIVDSVIDDIYFDGRDYTDTTNHFTIILSPEFQYGDTLNFEVFFSSPPLTQISSVDMPVNGREYLAISVLNSDTESAHKVDSILKIHGYKGMTTVGLTRRYLNHLRDFQTVFLFASTAHVLNYSFALPYFVDYLNHGGKLWLETGLNFWVLDNLLRNRLGAVSMLHRDNSTTIMGVPGTFAQGLSFSPSVTQLIVLNITDSIHSRPLLVSDNDSIMAICYQDSMSNAAAFWFSPVEFLSGNDIGEFYARGMSFLLTGVKEDDAPSTSAVTLHVPRIAHKGLRLQIPPHSEELRIKIFDAAGRSVMEKVFYPSSRPIVSHFYPAHSGVYFVVMKHNSISKSHKVVIFK